MGLIIYRILGIVFDIIELAIIIRAVISWLPIPRDSKLVYLLYEITEPVLAPIRSLIQRSSFFGSIMIDISPIIAFMLIRIVRTILLNLLF